MQVFAMPETALGLFPDAGASYFLSRLPGFYGSHISPFFIQLKYMYPCHFYLFNIVDVIHSPEILCNLIFSFAVFELPFTLLFLSNCASCTKYLWRHGSDCRDIIIYKETKSDQISG
jgi:ABC-type glycerol-3-phosphate transport system permease component